MNKDHLQTIKHFGEAHKVSSTYIYSLIHKGKLASEQIDGVYFVDVSKTPNLPTKTTKKHWRNR